MKILSIDVGIRNLSFCLFELITFDKPNNSLKIISWDNIDLSEQSIFKCIEIDKKGLICNKTAKFIKDGKSYCLKHSKQHNYLQPTPELKTSYLNKQKLQNLIYIANKYQIKYEMPAKKINILNAINEFVNANCYASIVNKSAKVDLVTIGRNIQNKLDNILGEHITNINKIGRAHV